MKEDNKVKCKYIFEENYNPKYVNGAFGGATPRGEIVINFYFERTALPKSQTFKIVEGKRGEEIREEIEPSDYDNSWVRIVENGIILEYKVAKEIHRWLGEHIKLLEESIPKNE